MLHPNTDTNESRPLLFIVGVPRSGTTLLRELLSQHSQISMPRDELQIIAKLINTLGEGASFSDPKVVHRFSQVFEHASCSYHLKDKQIKVNMNQLRRDVFQSDWLTAVKALLRQCLPDKFDAPILGEKTPSNLMHIEQFVRVLRNCRFIHIIRDPRDVCLSMQKAWGKSIYRGAAVWRDYQEHYMKMSTNPLLADMLFCLKYEDLVQTPEFCLRGICEFLSIDFEASMLTLRFAAEKLGDAAGFGHIASGVINKHVGSLDRKKVELIESITWPFLSKYGYKANYALGPRQVNRLRCVVNSVGDAARGIASQVRQKGTLEGVKYYIRQRLG